MSSNSATGSAAQSVQKWIINSDVENQFRLRALKRRLLGESLSHGSIELYLRCPSLAAIGWGEFQPFWNCLSLLRVDLTGLPKLESIPKLSFGSCRHLVSVVFGELSDIVNLGVCAFQDSSALKSITLPDKLKVIEQQTFNYCTSLERVVCNKNLKTIDDGAF